MFQLRNLRRNLKFTGLVIATTLGTVTLSAPPTSSHQVKVAQDIGVTMHLDPSHNPRVNKKSLAWFALTKKGGRVIPMKKCNCTLEVYKKPTTKDSKAILTPKLKPISAERYKNIPGAEITFTSVGNYELVLRGYPTEVGEFKPFNIKFPVTVAK